MTQTKPNSFLVFSAATAAIHFGCDETARVLLTRIAVQASLYNDPLSVTQTMNGFAYLASPATVHRKIDDLLDAGYLTFSYKGDNRRTKYLVPTDKANKYFDALAVAIDTTRETNHG